MKKNKQGTVNKVFNNDYNTGNLDFEFFGEITVHDEISEKFTDNSFSEYEKTELRKDLFEIFKDAVFYEKYAKIKRVPKNDMQSIYYHFVKLLPPNKYSSVQIFTEISEFMKFDYKEMFHKLMPGDKQNIITELDNEYDILEKKNIKRLF